MSKFYKPAPLVAQAEVAQTEMNGVLLHLHVPQAGGLEQLEGMFSATPTMKVIVTSPEVTIDRATNPLRRSDFEFLPRHTNPEFERSSIPDETALSFLSVVAGKTLRQIEQIVIEQTISTNGGSVPKAAKSLQVSPSTLYRKRESWQSRS